MTRFGWVTVLAANGPVFCAGMDLQAFLNGAGPDILFGAHGFAGFVKRTRKKPVIAAIEGAALAGGFEIMLACDLVVAGQSARFGLPEAVIGLAAAGGGALRLSHRIPRVIANEILLTGAQFSTEDADSWGLLNRVVPTGSALPEARNIAVAIAENAPLAIAASLRLSDCISQQLESEFWQENDQHIAELCESRDAREGIIAFFEKRDPVWRGW